MKNWQNKRLLVAEDEMDNYILISILLGETKIKITHAEDGNKALEYCLNEQFDAVFMDLNMPDMDGFEVTRKIREFNKDVIIIAQTAYAYKRETCIAAGFTDYLSKPFSKEKLINILGLYLDK